MVVSLANISPTHGSHYYDEENGSDQRSQWMGKLVDLLQLPSTVDPATLDHLLQGRDPQGRVLINKMRLAHDSVAGTPRAGIDLTTSAPKSVSIQSLIFNDHRLVEAHQQATRQMLEILEERYAMTRIRTDGERHKVVTGNLLIAQFHHSSSRALDPQLHSHNVILNLTQRADGKLQSLDNEAIYRYKMLLGQIYRNALAIAVEAMGYSVRRTNRQSGLWELQGFSESQLKQFSSRSWQIQQAVAADADSRTRAWAARFIDRPKKQRQSPEQLLEQWQQQAAALQINALVPVCSVASQNDAAELVRAAVAQCAQKPQPVRHEQIESTALALAVGRYDFAAISNAITQSSALTLIPNPQRPDQIQYTIRQTHEQTDLFARPPGNALNSTAPVEAVSHRNRGQSTQTQIWQTNAFSSASSQPTVDWTTPADSRHAEQFAQQIARGSRTPATDPRASERIESASSSPQASASQPQCYLYQNGWGRIRSQRHIEPAKAASEGTQPDYGSHSRDSERTQRDQKPAQKNQSVAQQNRTLPEQEMER